MQRDLNLLFACGNAFYTVTSSEQVRWDTCRVSSQQASGERHVSKKSFPALDSRNSAEEIPPSVNTHARYWCSAVRRVTDANKQKRNTDVITRQVSPCLSHAPHGDMLGFFPPGCSQERVVLELGEVLGAERKNKQTKKTK